MDPLSPGGGADPIPLGPGSGVVLATPRTGFAERFAQRTVTVTGSEGCPATTVRIRFTPLIPSLTRIE